MVISGIIARGFSQISLNVIYNYGEFPIRRLSLARNNLTPSMLQKRKRLRWLDVKENLTGLIFVLPALLVITMFGFFPIGYAFYMSLYRWQVRKSGFIGDDNYMKALGSWEAAAITLLGIWFVGSGLLAVEQRLPHAKDLTKWSKIAAIVMLIVSLFTISKGWGMMLEAGDKKFLQSLPITLFYSISTVPAELAIALVLAYVLFQKIRGKEFFRMLYFLPYITPVVATAVVFRTIFSPRETSLSNQIITSLGMDPQKWLFEPRPLTKYSLDYL